MVETPCSTKVVCSTFGHRAASSDCGTFRPDVGLGGPSAGAGGTTSAAALQRITAARELRQVVLGLVCERL